MSLLRMLREKIGKEQEGLTLIEVLAVIVILGLIIILVITRINSAGDKTNELGVKNDFRDFSKATESVLLESAGAKSDGSSLDDSLLNELLSKGLQFNSGVSQKKDPWGTPYTVKYAKATDVTASGTANGDAVIIISSNGKDKKEGTGDDLLLASYYYEGEVFTCTAGYKGDKNLNADGLKLSGKCGSSVTP